MQTALDNTLATSTLTPAVLDATERTSDRDSRVRPAGTTVRATSKVQLWIGRILTTIAVLFLTFDSVVKLLEVDMVLKGTAELGYPVSVAFKLGVVLAACTVLYVIPRTAAFGALFLTGYLGGAVATHVRVEHPLFSHTLFPIYLAVFIWAGLVLRDRRVRAAFGLGA
jgi:hypothetical protein